MSLFDDNNEESFYYDPQDEFQRRVLKHADAADDHPLAHLASKMSKAVDAMDAFVEQDPKLSKNERVAVKADVEEARESMERACSVIPVEVTQDGHDER